MERKERNCIATSIKVVGTWKHTSDSIMPMRERPYDGTVFKLNSDETAQILARDPRRPRRSREERRATAKEKRNTDE